MSHEPGGMLEVDHAGGGFPEVIARGYAGGREDGGGESDAA